jgi:hypothetical protein
MSDRERVVDAVAAALFFQAEQKRAVADRLVVSPFRGAATSEAFNRYLQSSVAEWAVKKQQLVQEAVQAYDRIPLTQPAASRRWTVAAKARKGQLYDAYVAQFKAIPMPAALAREAQARSAYENAVGKSIAPVIEAARSAFAECVAGAARLRVATDEAAACKKRLEE